MQHTKDAVSVLLSHLPPLTSLSHDHALQVLYGTGGARYSCACCVQDNVPIRVNANSADGCVGYFAGFSVEPAWLPRVVRLSLPNGHRFRAV